MSTNLDIQKVLQQQKDAETSLRLKCGQKNGDIALRSFQEPIENGTACPPYWDGITCWPQTPAGTLAVEPCAEWFHGFIPERNATRQCMENGVWYNSLMNKSWTNYTRCSDKNTTDITVNVTSDHNISEIFEIYVPVAKKIASTGYIVSFCTLIVALAIMLSIKKLHCARNILHMHLFASFLLRAFTFILSDNIIVDGIGLSSDYAAGYFKIDSETNNWGCKLVTTVSAYFLTANYMWILMEGLYLHNLIFRAMFVDSDSRIGWYVVMGWGLPLVVVNAWVTARIFIDDSLCWRTNDDERVFMVLAVPIMVSILVNFVLFLRISMVLFSKLRSPITDDNQMRYRKWIKSTLVLVPLFGVHYALSLLLYFSIPNDVVMVCWLMIDIFFGSFQGAIVAVLYCFLNGEVKTELAPRLYMVFTYLATNKYSKHMFPYRKKFLKSVVGRTSVCTTMSCSSLYTNGVLHRNSKARLETKKPEHTCHINGTTRQNQTPLNQAETTLSIECQTMRLCCEDETHQKMIIENNF